MPRWNVMGAGLLLTIGMDFFTVCPTRKAPNFTILSRGFATSICKVLKLTIKIVGYYKDQEIMTIVPVKLVQNSVGLVRHWSIPSARLICCDTLNMFRWIT